MNIILWGNSINVQIYSSQVTPEDITVRGGETAALKCAASGVPAPKVSWSKTDSGGDFPAAAERRIAVRSFNGSGLDDGAEEGGGGGATVIINSFVIYGVKSEDMGVYQCSASNPAGRVSWNITLAVLEVPR